MKTVILNRIITLDDVAMRDGLSSATAWMLRKCNEGLTQKKFVRGWDGKTVRDDVTVLAFVNNGRWGARCRVCNNPMYVSWKTPVFYCGECGNGGSSEAWRVVVPDEREAIEKALVKRALVVDDAKLIRNEVELAFQARAAVAGLGRNWRPGIGVQELEDETDQFEKGAKR